MKVHAELFGLNHDAEIRKDGRSVEAVIDGRKYAFEASEPEDGVYLFKSEGRVFEIFVSRHSAGQVQRVRVDENEFEIRLQDPKRLRERAPGAGNSSAAGEIKTAMPGKVVRLLLQEGNAVEEGQGVLVVEAMKMQNELKSPKAGVLTKLRVSEGATVSAGELLAVIE